MRKLEKQEIIRNQVDTINQYKILQCIKSFLDINFFEVYLYDKNIIKVIEKNNKDGFFIYDEDNKNIIFIDGKYANLDKESDIEYELCNI